LIRDLYLDERNGTLILGRSGVEKRVRLDRGMILGVASSLDDERMVPFLVQRGVLRAEQAETLKGLEDEQCAEILVQSGRITMEALAKARRELAQQVLTGVFRWESLEYRFEEGAAATGPATTNVVISFELIIRALRSMAGFEPIREALQRQDRALRLSEQVYLPFDQLSLTPVEGFLISRIDASSDGLTCLVASVAGVRQGDFRIDAQCKSLFFAGEECRGPIVAGRRSRRPVVPEAHRIGRRTMTRVRQRAAAGRRAR